MIIRILSFFLFINSIFLYAEKVDLQISIKNGTKNIAGRAETLRILDLSSGMTPIFTRENVSGKFTLKNIEVPEKAPVLIQLSYEGNNYNKIVPPVPEMRKALQEITVFDRGASFSEMKINSLIQITRREESLEVYKLFVIDNTSLPPKTFFPDSKPVEIYIPENASEISAQLKQQGSKMGIPLNLQEKGKEGRTLGRAILPGKSEIHIFFLIPVKNPSDAKFTDKLLFDTNNSYRPIFFQPKDLSLNFGKAKAEKLEKDIPGDMGAYKLNYSGKETVEITISGDAVLKPRESHGKETRRKLVNGNIFTSSTKSLLGVFAVFGLLLSLSFIFVYRQSRV